jgi:hypothetical protein
VIKRNEKRFQKDKKKRKIILFSRTFIMANSLETVVAWAKRKGFVYPNSEIY